MIEIQPEKKKLFKNMGKETACWGVIAESDVAKPNKIIGLQVKRWMWVPTA